MAVSNTVITVKLPDAVARRLDAGARRRGLSRSALVRQGIEQVLRGDEPMTAKESFLASASDLAGCVKGPHDLSHSKRHMEGFGRGR